MIRQLSACAHPRDRCAFFQTCKHTFSLFIVLGNELVTGQNFNVLCDCYLQLDDSVFNCRVRWVLTWQVLIDVTSQCAAEVSSECLTLPTRSVLVRESPW